MFTMVKSSLMLLKNKNKRNIIVTMFFCAMLMSFMGFNTFALTGSGTYDDPFIVKSFEDLSAMRARIEADVNWLGGGRYVPFEQEDYSMHNEAHLVGYRGYNGRMYLFIDAIAMTQNGYNYL